MCLRILDVNPKYKRNPGKDCSGRRNPIYVSRVLSAMVRITILQLCALCYVLISITFEDILQCLYLSTLTHKYTLAGEQ